MTASAPELSPSASRAEGQYARLVASFRRHGEKGGRFADGLTSFLTHFVSAHTKRAYSFAIFEFFDWMEVCGGRSVLPDRIERKTAVEYASYLGSRDEGLDESRLGRDGRRGLELLIYRTVRSRPDISYEDLRTALVAQTPREMTERERREGPLWFHKLTACMVRSKLVDRSPTVEELRTVYRGKEPPPFTFRVHVHSEARGVERAATVFSRLAVLASLWSWWIDNSGENTGSRALLEHNVWEPLLEQYAAPARAQHQASRDKKTPSLATLTAVVRTTYTHKPTSYEAIRDRALLLFMLYTAVRPEEVSGLTRSSLTGSPPIVTVLGKRRKARQFLLPPEVGPHLGALTQKLEEMAAHDARFRPGQESRARRLLSDAAPLFPVGRPYGCNVSGDDFLSRDGIAMMLRRRGKLAGFEGTDEFRTLHPHGIRHLAARIAVASGTPLSRVQAILGHEHLSTTGVYVEERDPRSLVLFTRPPVAPAAPAAPLAALGAPATGITVREVPPVPPVPPAAPRAPVATAEPVAPPRRRLVEVGGPPSREALGGRPEVTIAPPMALDEVYLPVHWGEDKRRSALHTTKHSDEDRLTFAYMGKKTHLVWWKGAGQLVPEMPVMSFRQAMEDTARFGPPIQKGLTELWLAWYGSAEQGRGPTAASALVQWTKEALATMDQVEADRLVSRRTWVPFDAEIAPDALTLREHREDKILAWFQARAHTWTMSERGRVKDTATVPAWYSEADPLAAIPPEARSELFDWVSAMTGRQPVSKEKVFPETPGGEPKLTRKELASLVAYFCVFNDAAEELADQGQKIRMAEGGGVRLPTELKLTNDAIRKLVEKLTGGRVRSFDFALKTLSRMQRTKKKEEEGKEGQRETKRLFVLDILGELFGPTAKEDEPLSIYASCEHKTLEHAVGAPGGWKDFFRFEDGTIEHTHEFQKEFAEATGLHSECVARRVVRGIFELRGEKSRVTRQEHRGELENQLATWMAFRVPCPASLEAELEGRLEGRTSQALGRAFSRTAERELEVGMEHDEREKVRRAIYKETGREPTDLEIREEMEARLGPGARSHFEERALGAGGGYHLERNPRSLRRVSSYCPTPIVLVFWAHLRTRQRSRRFSRY